MSFSPETSPGDTKQITNPRKRTKPLTSEILGDLYVEDLPQPATLLSILEPLPDVKLYTKERSLQSLSIVDQILRSPRRKLSPIGMRGHELYRSWIISLLQVDENLKQHKDDEELINDLTDKEVEDHKLQLCTQIRMFETTAQFNKVLQLTNSKDTQALMTNLVTMLKSGIYARYDDYFADACKELKIEATQKEDGINKEQLKAYWTVIAAKLRGEEKHLPEAKSAAYKYVIICPTRSAVEDAVGHTGFKFEDMLCIIQEYATCNDLFHSNLMTTLVTEGYYDVSKRLYDDFCQIPLLFPKAENSRADLMQMLINTKIDLWFDRSAQDPDNYKNWCPNQTLRDLMEKKDLDINAALKEDRRNVHKLLQKRLAKREEEARIVESMKFITSLNMHEGKVKRVASKNLENEKIKVSRQANEWNKVRAISRSFRTMSESYIKEFGHDPPIEKVSWSPSLDDSDSDQ